MASMDLRKSTLEMKAGNYDRFDEFREGNSVKEEVKDDFLNKVSF